MVRIEPSRRSDPLTQGSTGWKEYVGPNGQDSGRDRRFIADGRVMAGMVGIGALGAFSRSIITLGDRLQKVSIQTGIAVEELEILQYAASQTGVGTDQLNAAIQKFSINIGKAEDGTVAQLDAFEALGISLENNEGNLKDTSQLFVEVADGISKVEDPATKARIASDFLEEQGSNF